MSKNIRIREDELKQQISLFGNISNEVEKRNTDTFRQVHFYINHENKIQVLLDIYLKKNNNVSITASGNTDSKKIGNQIIKYLESLDQYRDAPHTSFSVKNLEQTLFDSLVTYLSSIIGVAINEKSIESNHIHKVVTNDFSDKIDIHFYPSTKTFHFQGYKRELFVEVKTFLTTLAMESIINVPTIIDQIEMATSADALIQSLMPNSHTKIHPLMLNLIKDSFNFMFEKKEMNDYSPWTMSILKVVEYRVKNILDTYSIPLSDTHSFRFNKTHSVFNSTGIKDEFVVNSSISVIINDTNVCNALVECYKFLRVNRNPLFHTTQIAAFNVFVPTQHRAETIISSAAKLIEKTYLICP